MSLKAQLSARFLRETRQDEAKKDESKEKETSSGRDALVMRKVRVFSIDPTIGGEAGGVSVVELPFEKLEAAEEQRWRIVGKRFVIDAAGFPPPKRRDAKQEAEKENDKRKEPIRPRAKFDLGTSAQLVAQGYDPSLSDPRFIVQMLYAVAASLDDTFTTALGRQPVLDLGRQVQSGDSRGRLILHPWKAEEANAWFDRNAGEVCFGYFEAEAHARGYPPESIVYQALSHDVIVHEVSHALLDAVRPHFSIPVNADCLAFHEAFGDLMVVFQRLSYPDLVQQQIARARGQMSAATLLGQLATGFAQTAGVGYTLRDLSGDLQLGSIGEEPHRRGTVLVQAIFGVFRTVVEQRIEAAVMIATQGSGVLPAGALSPPLLAEISRRVRKTAKLFQSLMIRALDYCPPVGLTMADFLSALIAADRRLVPHDPEGIRHILMESFRMHGIFPRKDAYFSEDSLTEHLLSQHDAASIPDLSFAKIGFSGEPGEPLDLVEAFALGWNVGKAMQEGGGLHAVIAGQADKCFSVSDVPVEIVSARSFARPGPGGMTEFGTVVELVQSMQTGPSYEAGFMSGGGATLLFDSQGTLRSLATRKAGADANSREALRFAESSIGQRVWERANGSRKLRPGYLSRMCLD